MKKILVALLLVAFALPLRAAPANRPAVSAGIRRHTDHSVMTELPFDEGDISYTAGWEIHDPSGYWQLLIGYTPEVGGTNAVDYVITPQLNLLLEDRGWQAGVGVLGSYVKTDAGSDWTDVYWQFLLGFTLQLPAFSVDIVSYYPFKSWGDLSDFDTGDLEFGVMFKLFY
jgi:hypothetical protein